MHQNWNFFFLKTMVNSQYLIDRIPSSQGGCGYVTLEFQLFYFLCGVRRLVKFWTLMTVVFNKPLISLGGIAYLKIELSVFFSFFTNDNHGHDFFNYYYVNGNTSLPSPSVPLPTLPLFPRENCHSCIPSHVIFLCGFIMWEQSLIPHLSI